MRAPERFETERLLLRKPMPADADVIFARYASDPAVTRYLSWKTHASVVETQVFLEFSEREWARWGAGPYWIEELASGDLVGGTGFTFRSEGAVETGYVLAQNAWGRGYATEALRGVISIARRLGLEQLFAMCHPEHAVSARVLQKCGFEFEARLTERLVFPNLASDTPQDCLRFVLRLQSGCPVH